jgi:predicted GIY-YIG superfamily endonuclease
MLASRRHGTLYSGVTNDLSQRVSPHQSKAAISVWKEVWHRGARLVTGPGYRGQAV